MNQVFKCTLTCVEVLAWWRFPRVGGAATVVVRAHGVGGTPYPRRRRLLRAGASKGQDALDKGGRGRSRGVSAKGRALGGSRARGMASGAGRGGPVTKRLGCVQEDEHGGSGRATREGRRGEKEATRLRVSGCTAAPQVHPSCCCCCFGKEFNCKEGRYKRTA